MAALEEGDARSSSSALTWRLTADCVTNSSCAARVKAEQARRGLETAQVSQLAKVGSVLRILLTHAKHVNSSFAILASSHEYTAAAGADRRISEPVLDACGKCNAEGSRHEDPTAQSEVELERRQVMCLAEAAGVRIVARGGRSG